MSGASQKVSGRPGDIPASPFSPQAIHLQLQRILASPDFDATGQQRAFLEFVVRETLAGNSNDIKGYTIATRVFGRGENFDQAVDPIVSIQANKLRRSLERYYLLSGRGSGIRIEIPKGTYVPVFIEQERGGEIPASRASIDRHPLFPESWPTILIKPFHNLTNDPDKQYWGDGFANELALEINRLGGITVMRYGPEGQVRRSSDVGVRFIIEGSIRQDSTCIKVDVRLIDNKFNSQLWSDTRRTTGDISKIITFQEQTASIIGAIVAGDQGIICRTLSAEAKGKQPDQLSTYEAILRYHEYDQTFAPEDFREAFDALEYARVHEPESGLVWSFLARLYANIYSLEIPGFAIAEAEQKALAYAEQGSYLLPASQMSRAILAHVKMLSNDIESARRENELAYQLNPHSFYMMDGIGYIKTLLGDWEHGPALIRKTIKANPYYKTVVHYALWLDCLRQKDFENAYLETTELRRPAIFWYPLVKSSTLGLLGRIEEAGKFARDLLELKPDFRERGRLLISRYIKFDEIADQVIAGLAEAGIEVE